MREETYARIDHPNFLPWGSAVIVDREAMDGLVARLHNGVPTLGWAGDPRLCVAFHRPTQRWELVRLERDGQYRIICRSKPGMAFPDNLIQSLVAHDGRRGYHVGRDIMAHNDKLQADKDAAGDARLREIKEKVYYAVGKDVGHLY